MNMITRLKLAWKTFNLEPFEVFLNPYELVAGTASAACDFSCEYLNGEKAGWYDQDPCHNEAEYCISRLGVRLEVTRQEHLHLCEEHSSQLLGMPIAVYYGKNKGKRVRERVKDNGYI